MSGGEVCLPASYAHQRCCCGTPTNGLIYIIEYRRLSWLSGVPTPIFRTYPENALLSVAGSHLIRSPNIDSPPSTIQRVDATDRLSLGVQPLFTFDQLFT